MPLWSVTSGIQIVCWVDFDIRRSDKKGKMNGQTDSMMDEKMRACIQECQNCQNVCTETITHCLQIGGDHAEPNHIRLQMDCAEICLTSANFMLRMSDLHAETCGVCAEVCERCAEDCERFGDDEMMQQCAQACRSCAQSCHEMAGMMA
jgi:hypothetical protein